MEPSDLGFFPFPCTNVRLTTEEMVEFCDWLLDNGRIDRTFIYGWTADIVRHVRSEWTTGALKATFVDPRFGRETDRIEFMLRFADAIGRSEYRV